MNCPWDGKPATAIGGGFIEVGEYHEAADHYCEELSAERYQCTGDPAHTFFPAGEPATCKQHDEN